MKKAFVVAALALSGSWGLTCTSNCGNMNTCDGIPNVSTFSLTSACPARVSFPLVRTTSARINLDSVAFKCTHVSFPGLVEAGGIVLQQATVLQQMSFPSLKTVADRIVLSGAVSLAGALEFPLLEHGGVDISSCSMDTLLLPKAISMTTLEIDGNPALVEISAPVLSSVTSDLSNDGFLVTNNPRLAGMQLPFLTKIDAPSGLEIAGSDALTTFPLASLHYVTKAYIHACSSMTSLLLPSGRSFAAGAVTVNENAQLREIDLGSMASATDVEIHENEKLQQVFCSNMTLVTNALSIERNPLLQQVSFSSLSFVNQQLSLLSNPSLAVVNLPNLSFVGCEAAFTDNAALRGLSLPKLRMATGSKTNLLGGACEFKVQGNQNLVSVDLPLLAAHGEGGGCLNVVENQRLESMNTGALLTSGVPVCLNLQGNPSLSSLGVYDSFSELGDFLAASQAQRADSDLDQTELILSLDSRTTTVIYLLIFTTCLLTIMMICFVALLFIWLRKRLSQDV